MFASNMPSRVVNYRDFYNDRRTTRDEIRAPQRATHNFIKAVLIQSYCPRGASVLDLGCGQGGDLLKWQHMKIASYHGIDASSTAISACSGRLKNINFTCTTRLQHLDFAVDDWHTDPVDVVSCQFALHYAFRDSQSAEHTMSRVARALKPGGLFIGTVPVHESPAYSMVRVKLPDDDRMYEEPCAPREAIEACGKCFGLQARRWTDFTSAYREYMLLNPTLARQMRVSVPPDPNYAIFVFERA